ncbi:hypothetical protein Fmac_015436 [Flemingia macrophylla]|uniref:Uncharacterized protein n=1 Tax=Flemingia macrophylla TaxID=520843 RepID=A0ABD1MEJ9_9FABA
MYQTYSLEHQGESDLFVLLFQLLNSSIRYDESFSKELASNTGALKTPVSTWLRKRNMYKSTKVKNLSVYLRLPTREFKQLREFTK